MNTEIVCHWCAGPITVRLRKNSDEFNTCADARKKHEVETCVCSPLRYALKRERLSNRFLRRAMELLREDVPPAAEVEKFFAELNAHVWPPCAPPDEDDAATVPKSDTAAAAPPSSPAPGTSPDARDERAEAGAVAGSGNGSVAPSADTASEGASPGGARRDSGEDPARDPAAGGLSEEQLAEMERDAKAYIPDGSHTCLSEDLAKYVPRLVAEVRRLREKADAAETEATRRTRELEMTISVQIERTKDRDAARAEVYETGREMERRGQAIADAMHPHRGCVELIPAVKNLSESYTQARADLAKAMELLRSYVSNDVADIHYLSDVETWLAEMEKRR